jgi:hypothetical protein
LRVYARPVVGTRTFKTICGFWNSVSYLGQSMAAGHPRPQQVAQTKLAAHNEQGVTSDGDHERF